MITFTDCHGAENQKSASFISTNTEDNNDKLMQSTVSIEGHLLGTQTEDGTEAHGGESDEIKQEIVVLHKSVGLLQIFQIFFSYKVKIKQL